MLGWQSGSQSRADRILPCIANVASCMNAHIWTWKSFHSRFLLLIAHHLKWNYYHELSSISVLRSISLDKYNGLLYNFNNFNIFWIFAVLRSKLRPSCMQEVTLSMEQFIKYPLNSCSIDKMWFKTAVTLALTQFCPFPIEKALLLFYMYTNSISYFQRDFFLKSINKFVVYVMVQTLCQKLKIVIKVRFYECTVATHILWWTDKHIVQYYYQHLARIWAAWNMRAPKSPLLEIVFLS